MTPNQRREKAKEMRLAGKTFREIGESLGVSQQRACQLAAVQEYTMTDFDAESLRKAIDERCVNISALERKIKVGEGAIYAAYRGRTAAMHKTTLAKLAEFFGVEESEFLAKPEASK